MKAFVAISQEEFWPEGLGSRPLRAVPMQQVKDTKHKGKKVFLELLQQNSRVKN